DRAYLLSRFGNRVDAAVPQLPDVGERHPRNSTVLPIIRLPSTRGVTSTEPGHVANGYGWPARVGEPGCNRRHRVTCARRRWISICSARSSASITSNGRGGW